MPFDDKTVHEQKAWEHYSKIEAENHHLKNQLSRVHKENRRLVNQVKKLANFKRKIDAERKERYRNNGKKRVKSNRSF